MGEAPVERRLEASGLQDIAAKLAAGVRLVGGQPRLLDVAAGVGARVDDAGGLEAPAAAQSSVDADTTASPKEIEEKIWDELRTVYDPEIPANVVDLGLVYGVDVSDHADGGYKIHVTMTLTAPGCGMGDEIGRAHV